MKVLLTGASGFVGSHILDSLRARGFDTALLLRPTSSREFLQRHLSEVEVRTGAIEDAASLGQALHGITHVIHCAGCTKAPRPAGFYEVNQTGTRRVVEAVNSRCPRVERLVQISSLAATGPATRQRPARETDPPHPISHYGKSKLAAEQEVTERSRAQYTILRPPAVYGPRDEGFFPMFRAVRRHLLPRPNRRQDLSLVFATDLAEAVVRCLIHPAAANKTFFIAPREVVTGRLMAEEIAGRMGRWTLPCPLPASVLWAFCLAQELQSRLTGRARMLNLQKFAELRAPGWVCDPSLLENEIGFECKTDLREGIARTLSWYNERGWL